MTYFRIGSGTIQPEEFLGLMIVLLIIGIIAWLAFFYLKIKDQNKPLQKVQCKVLERVSKNGNIEWYLVEFEDGSRKRLRNFHALDKVIISPGDRGVIEVRGITIQAFHPNSIQN